jgi:hypothetical protein
VQKFNFAPLKGNVWGIGKPQSALRVPRPMIRQNAEKTTLNGVFAKKRFFS